MANGQRDVSEEVGSGRSIGVTTSARCVRFWHGEGEDREHAVLRRVIDMAKRGHQHRFSNQRDRMIRSLSTLGIRRDNVCIRDQVCLAAFLEHVAECVEFFGHQEYKR